MESDLKCSLHQDKKAYYICSHSQCIENLICLSCVISHNPEHTKRLVIIGEVFSDQNSIFHIVKKKKLDLECQLESILKSKQALIININTEVDDLFDKLIKETLRIIQEFKEKCLAEVKDNFIRSKIDLDKIEQVHKSLNQTKLEEGNEIMNMVNKIKALEDELIPLATNEMKLVKESNEEEISGERFKINPKIIPEFLEKMNKVFMEISVFGSPIDNKLKEITEIALKKDLMLSLEKKLALSSPTKLEANKIHTFHELLIENGGILSVDAWDGTKGGRLILIYNSLIIKPNGSIDVSNLGYRGGEPCAQWNGNNTTAYYGESFNGKGGQSSEPNQGGGGGGPQSGAFGSCGGGGGGYGTPGTNAQTNIYNNGNNPGGKGGLVYGDEGMTTIYMGSGGGGGAPYSGGTKGKGGNGGGLIMIIAKELRNEGKIKANGENGEDANPNTYGSRGGGGSGGSIFIIANSFEKGDLSVNGGKGGKQGNHPASTQTNGGDGGLGRIKIINFDKVEKINVFGLNY